MDTNKKFTPWVAVLLFSIILLSACTKKDNLTGNNFSDVNATTFMDSTAVINGFSFPADTLRAITGSETKILIGSIANASAISYMRFTSLPRRTAFDVLDSCFINIKMMKRSEVPRDPLRITLHKIMRTWTDSLSTITESDISTIPFATYEIPSTLNVTGEDVKINLPFSSLFDYETGADSTGWNIAIKAENQGWVELASAETVNGAVLSFKYKAQDATSFTAYSAEAAKDSYLLVAPPAVESSAWILNNLSPTRMFVKLLPNNSMFTNSEGNPLTASELKQVTINKATLVLHVKDNPYYTGTTSYSVFPYNVTRDGVEGITSLVKADYEVLLYTMTNNGTVKDDSLEIDITPIIQAYTSGDRIPKGIMLQSLQERQNFGYVEFYDSFAATPAAKKPLIKVTYTPPYLKQ
ncbi:MAG: hypothetical protein PHO32_00355 [Candidatus Cloacimonetes bacterium]|nr:hypothetical protein [Candidatus Cloacimonadota bacterium]